jgi:hypothetical protein
MRSGPIEKLKSEPTSQARGNILPNIPTPDMRTPALAARLMKAGVPRDEDFINGLLGQLITAGDLGGRHDDLEVSFLFSVMEGIKPRDMVEAMIASQMGMIQTNIVKQSRRLNRTLQGCEDGPVNSLTKLVRTFVTLSEALTRHRNGGGPNVSVGHVIRRRQPGDRRKRDAEPRRGGTGGDCPFTAAPCRRKGRPNAKH